MKRSAILLLLLALVSFSLVLFTSYQSAAASIEPEQESPVKCSGGCNKKNPSPLPWNLITPAMFPSQG